MPPKHRKQKKQRGKGIVGDAAKFVRDNKLISKGLGLIPHPGAQAASQVASFFGLGRKKMKGRGIFSDLGGGIGSALGGLGGGIGSIAHGFFGSGRPQLSMIVGRPVVAL